MCVFFNFRHHWQPSWYYTPLATQAHTHTHTYTILMFTRFIVTEPVFLPLFTYSSSPLSVASLVGVEEQYRWWMREATKPLWIRQLYIYSGNLPPSPGTLHWLVWWTLFSQSGITLPEALGLIFFFTGERDYKHSKLSMWWILTSNRCKTKRTCEVQFSLFELGIFKLNFINYTVKDVVCLCPLEWLRFWHPRLQDVIICQCLSKTLTNHSYKTFFWLWLAMVWFS